MNKEYYTIVRKYYGLPDYLSTDMLDEDECFCFNTEHEANKCLYAIFKGGELMQDEKYGKVRYYVERRTIR